MSDLQRDIQIFRDNAQLSAGKITLLQQKLMNLISDPDSRQSRLGQEVERAKKLVDKYQEEATRMHTSLEKAQKEYASTHDSLTQARESYLQIEKRLQDDLLKKRKEQEKERTKLDNDIRLAQRTQRTWEDRAVSAERNFQLEQKRAQEAAAHNRVSDSRGARSRNLR